MIWAMHKYSPAKVQHVGLLSADGLATYCNTKPVNEDNERYWEVSRNERFPRRRPCIRCVGVLMQQNGDDAALFRWIKRSVSSDLRAVA